MSFQTIPLNPTRRMLRQFAAGWVVVFGVLAGEQVLRGGAPAVAGLLGGAILPGVVGLAAPRSIRWLFLVVTVLTYPIGVVVSNVLIALMYYLVMTPLGLVLRLGGRDPLMLRKPPAGASCWHDCAGRRVLNRYLKQF